MIRDIRERWNRFASSPHGRWVLKAIRVAFTIGILAYLGYELTRIGWGQVWRSLPTNPLFYVLFLVLYFSLPITEVFIYRVTWAYDLLRSVPIFLKKRIYNKDVLGYSGEVYFFAWARKAIQRSEREILETIRDNNIISSVASTLIAVVLLLVFLYEGELSIGRVVDQWVGEDYPYYLIGAGIVALVVGPLVVRFRRYIFSMPLNVAALIFAIQCVRLVLGQGIQIAQWEVAVPEVSLRVWFTYAAASLIVSRIPLVPNRDLIFMAAGIELGARLQVPEAGIAGMLVVLTVLNKALNFALFALISLWTRFGTDQSLAADEEPPAPEALEARVNGGLDDAVSSEPERAQS